MFEIRSRILRLNSPESVACTLHELLQDEESSFSLGSFSLSIYDTAWVSMVREKRQESPESSWLFPESFEYVLRSQTNDGSWPSYASPVDGILNTLASLLALLEHQQLDADSTFLLDGSDSDRILNRIERARHGLHAQLQAWCVEETSHIGFEILVPGLLRKIERHGIIFTFPGRTKLFDLCRRKTISFKPETSYMEQPTTILHSLEAFAGDLDFDKVRHHCDKYTGIFGSPAATAAYLINCSSWDDRAENYLKHAVSQSLNGGVPSAFPTAIFESSWALSLLLDGVIKKEDLAPAIVNSLIGFYQNALNNQAGIVGFAPRILGDADDTARVLMVLHLLGAKTDPIPLIERFRSESCFRTYELEGNSSFSASCNVLLALLCSEPVVTLTHSTLIQRTIEHLLSVWASGEVLDKWNLSPHYVSMLFSDVLMRVMECHDQKRLQCASKILISRQIPIALCKILSKTVSTQNTNGTWGASVEETAYCVLTLVKLLMLPWSSDLCVEVMKSFDKARQFLLEAPDDEDPNYLWTEKVTYGSCLLSRTYKICAINSTIRRVKWTADISRLLAPAELYSSQLRPMIARLPLFVGKPLKYIEVALVEATRLAEGLQQERNLIFPRDKLPMTKDKYLSFIPIIWTVCNHMRGNVLPSNCIWQMTILSMLNYQVDEYMETVINDMKPPEIRALISYIRRRCGLQLSHLPSPADSFGLDEIQSSGMQPSGFDAEQHDPEGFAQTEAACVIGAYITHILGHKSVLSLKEQDRHALAAALDTFLTSHIAQNLNSGASLGRVNLNAPTETLPVSQRGYFTWVRGLGAESTSCPVSFQFFLALMGPAAASIYEGPRLRYFARALAAHLATLCRMYNDFGSESRDAEEGSLNSLDFVEFQESVIERVSTASGTEDPKAAMCGEQDGGNRKAASREMKDELLNLAEFERSMMEMSFNKLEQEVKRREIMGAIRVFIEVTDLFGQIYVQRDIASRVKKGKLEE